MKIKDELLKINSDYTNPSVARIWDSFELIDIIRIEKMYEPIISIYHNKNTVMIEYWEVDKEENSHLIEIPDCHISDDMVEYYFGGLALFLNLIRPDTILFNYFDFDKEAEEEIYYDMLEYLENLEGERVSFIATEILMREIIWRDEK